MKKMTEMICLECNKPFLKETRYVNRGEGKFCSQTCSTIYMNNSKIEIELTCQHCNNTYMSTNKNSKYCSKYCCGKARKLRNVGSTITRSSLSQKINKALSTGTNKCLVCNWNKSICDIHHIINKQHGGTDSFDNLTILCPNCHRLMHNNLLVEIPPTVSYVISVEQTIASSL